MQGLKEPFKAMLDLSQVSANHTSTQMLNGAALSEAFKALMRRQRAQLIKDAEGGPVLMSFSSDGTPLSSKVRAKIQLEEKAHHRSGSQCSEYLVQLAAYRAFNMSGDAMSCVFMKEPMPLTNGKTADALFAADTSFAPTLRAMGHTGIAIQHHVYDRAMFSALMKRNAGRYVVQAADRGLLLPGGPTGRAAVLDKLRHWDIYTPCGLHDCHNSVKWQWKLKYADERKVLRDVFDCVAAVRSSYGQIMAYMPMWVVRKLDVVDDSELPSADGLAELWLALGLAQDIVDILAQKLRLQWRDGRLRVAASAAAGGAPIVDDVCNVLISVWEFSQSQ